MRRALLLCLAIIGIALLEFFLFPGHTYLRADTQIFVPMLERLNTPNFLSRDMVATTPHLVYTAYDEITLFLHRILHQDLRRILLLQLFVSRLSSLYGVFLIAAAAGVRNLHSLIIASLVTVAVAFPGMGPVPSELEPVPHTLAFGFCLLAVGMLCDGKPLLSGLAGGVALLYHFPLAAVFWLVLVTAFVCDPKLRILLRPTLTIFIVFVLLLGNLAQLQPGVAQTQSLFGRVSENWWQALHNRTPEVFISSWPRHVLLLYLIISIAGVLAVARIWQSLNRQSKWLFSVLLASGVLSLPLSALMLDVFRWSLITQVQPARTALFTVALSVTAAGIAARLTWLREPRQTATWCCFIALCAVVWPLVALRSLRADSNAAGTIHEVARWAKDNTWGSSMFLLPDAGRDVYPGVFRAESIRAVYADWGGGELTKYFEPFAEEWRKRWEQTMSGQYSPERLHRMLSLPVDYYVLQRKHAVAGVRPAFATGGFLVYDAHDLKSAVLARPQVDLDTRRGD